MTPKEKAQELVSRFVSINLSQVNDLVDGIRIRLAKESAFIAADEVIDTLKDEDLYIQGETNINEFIDYWQEVQQEIQNL